MSPGHVVETLTRLIALLGGVVLFLIMAITIISVIGGALRNFGLASIPGEEELVKALSAIAVFCFLPLCQYERGHVAIDLLTSKFPSFLNAWLTRLFDFVFFLIASLISWRLALGTIDKYNNGETSFILQFPLWWAYLACTFAAIIWTVVCLANMLSRREALTIR